MRDYEQRLSELSAIIYRVDPIGLNFDVNADEYDPEAGTILPRLEDCHSIGEVDGVVRGELNRWFTPELVERSSTVNELVDEVWAWWQRVRDS